MAKLISGDRIVPVWLDAVEQLAVSGHRCRNLLLEIETPVVVTPEDRAVIALIDPVLSAHDLPPVMTVAGTIFPFQFYRRTGFEDLPSRFLSVMNRAKVGGQWGTYAMRLMSRPGKNSQETINPLYEVVRKLRKASTDGVGYNSNYELGVHAPVDLISEDIGCEVPLYSPSDDCRKIGNYPCLSHLTFKLVDRTTLELTAIYRSHYYLQRALGNLVGLTHLMRFVAIETGLTTGRLTCISTDAHLDVPSWGGSAQTMTLMNQIKEALAEGAGDEPTTQMSDSCTPA